MASRVQAMASGRSSAFFFVSPDQRFLLKTMSSTEHRLMLRLLQPCAHARAPWVATPP